MRVPVLWAIRDSRALSAPEKALLYAVETRGVHYGTWETVAADAGMKRDAYYRWRARLETRGVLSVTERPGRTTVHEVNADWFSLDTIPANAKDPSEEPAPTVTANKKDRSGDSATEGNYEGHHVSGDLSRKKKLVRVGEPIYLRLVRPNEMNAWDRAEHHIDSMTQDERADWHAQLEAEAHLP